jgi:hypothetical protein
VARTIIFSKDIFPDDGRDFDIYDVDGNFAYVFNAAMLPAIRASDTGESQGAYVVDGFCSQRCILAAATSDRAPD